MEDGLTVSLSVNGVEYSIDGNDNWTALSVSSRTPTINKDHYISFRGNLTPTKNNGVGTFTYISKPCDLTGNCNSLLFGDDAVNNLDLTGKDYAFYQLFYNCTTIKNVSSNFLPATTLAYACYGDMFNRCTSLTTAPELPATTLADYCYYYMFDRCTSLTTAPELPATTLADYCYIGMFQDCNNITKIKSNTVPDRYDCSGWVSTDKIGIFIGPESTDYIWRGTNGVPKLFVYAWDENYNMNDVILFYVSDSRYSFIAKKGMTWEQLINSYEYNGYNDLGLTYFCINNGAVSVDPGGGIYQTIQKDGVDVSLNDVIVENYIYTCYYPAGGGNPYE